MHYSADNKFSELDAMKNITNSFGRLALIELLGTIVPLLIQCVYYRTLTASIVNK